jgi:Protein of unknown function (DUF2802)
MPTWISSLSLDQLPFPVSLELLLIVGRAAALVGALCVFAWAFSRWRVAQGRDTQRIFEQMDLIQGELHALAEAVGTITARLEGLTEKVDAESQLTPAHVASGQRVYENAIRLAQRGAASDEIIAHCGLVRREADLIVRLHGRNGQERRPLDGESAAVSSFEAQPVRKRLAVVG